MSGGGHQPRQPGNKIDHRQRAEEKGDSISEVTHNSHGEHARAETFNRATLVIQAQLQGKRRYR